MEEEKNKRSLLDPEKVYIGLINSEKYDEWETQERYKINKISQEYNEKLKSMKKDHIFVIIYEVFLDLCAIYFVHLGLNVLENPESNIFAIIVLTLASLGMKGMGYYLLYLSVARHAKDKTKLEIEKKQKVEKAEEEFEKNKILKKEEIFKQKNS